MRSTVVLVTVALFAGCTGQGSGAVCPGGICGADAAAGTGAGGFGGSRVDGGGGARADAGSTLVAAYSFDEATGTVAVDSSGNFNNAGLVGAADWGTPGHAAGDVSLTGGYVIMPPNMLDHAGEFTFAAWVRLRTDRIWQRIFDFGSNTHAYLFLTPHSTSDTFRLAIISASVVSEQRIDAVPFLPTGVWKHVAVTLNGAVGALYVDGQSVATNPVTLRPVDAAPMTNDWLGRSEFGADPSFDGEIDQVRIYDRALSSAEIAALFAGP